MQIFKYNKIWNSKLNLVPTWYKASAMPKMGGAKMNTLDTVFQNSAT